MRKILGCYFIVILLFLFSPLLVMLYYSFRTKLYGIGGDFTIIWYQKFFHDRTLLPALGNSLSVAFVSSFLAITGAVFISYYLCKYEFRLKKPFRSILTLVLITPDITMATGYMLVFQAVRLMPGFATVTISHITFQIAFAVLIISARLNKLDANTEAAARDLGASEWQVIRYITLPYIWPAIITATLVCFTLSWDDFIYSFFNSGASRNMLPVQIFAFIKRGISPEINAVGSLSMILSFSLLFLSLRFQKLFLDFDV